MSILWYLTAWPTILRLDGKRCSCLLKLVKLMPSIVAASFISINLGTIGSGSLLAAKCFSWAMISRHSGNKIKFDFLQLVHFSCPCFPPIS